MNLVSWNCQGLGATLAIKALKELTKMNKPSLVFLMETRMKKEKLEKIKRRYWGMRYSFYVDPVGVERGLALWWSKGVKVEVMEFSKHFIHTKVKGAGEDFNGWISFLC